MLDEGRVRRQVKWLELRELEVEELYLFEESGFVV